MSCVRSAERAALLSNYPSVACYHAGALPDRKGETRQHRQRAKERYGRQRAGGLRQRGPRRGTRALIGTRVLRRSYAAPAGDHFTLLYSAGGYDRGRVFVDDHRGGNP